MSAPETAAQVLSALKAKADPATARALQKYFKTGPGEYGEGDRFLGLKVGPVGAVARDARGLAENHVAALLGSRWHEARLLALILLNERSRKAKDPAEIKRLAVFLQKHRAGVNNWDLVDTAAPVVLGRWLLQTWRADPPAARAWAFKFAGRKNLWDRRMAVLACFALVRDGDHRLMTEVCAKLLDDREDLIHKATGWMLREVGKRSPRSLDDFLTSYSKRMPRTMLRYAIEKKSPAERARWMRR